MPTFENNQRSSFGFELMPLSTGSITFRVEYLAIPSVTLQLISAISISVVIIKLIVPFLYLNPLSMGTVA
jgi:hypothetical protein